MAEPGLKPGFGGFQSLVPLPSAPAGLEALARGGAAEASGRGSLWFQDGFLRETGQGGGCSLPRRKRID